VILVNDITVDETAAGWRLSAAVDSSSPLGQERMHFTIKGAEPSWLTASGDPFLAALLLPAMAFGEDLVIEAPVSPRLRRSARTVMDIYSAWWGHRHRRVKVHFPVAAPPAGGAGRDAVGLFFSAGVDSFYSLLKDIELSALADQPPVTYLLHANFKRRHSPAHDRLLDRLGRVADETGRTLVVIETNVRSLTGRATHWIYFHGAALGSVGLALQGLLGRCLIAASDNYSYLPPLGSHPLIDHLWSTESLELVHDGAEATRTDKIAGQIARSALALESLMVCWRSQPDENCGVCDKCLRTMASLEMAGCLDQCTTFPRSLDLDLLAAVPIPGEPELVSMRELLTDAERRGRGDLVEAIEESLRGYG
jgi:hypothetical protein